MSSYSWVGIFLMYVFARSKHLKISDLACCIKNTFCQIKNNTIHLRSLDFLSLSDFSLPISQFSFSFWTWFFFSAGFSFLLPLLHNNISFLNLLSLRELLSFFRSCLHHQCSCCEMDHTWTLNTSQVYGCVHSVSQITVNQTTFHPTLSNPICWLLQPYCYLSTVNSKFLTTGSWSLISSWGCWIIFFFLSSVFFHSWFPFFLFLFIFFFRIHCFFFSSLFLHIISRVCIFLPQS